MTVRDLVGGEVVWIAPERTMREAVQLMADNDIGALAVEVKGRLTGIVTERDVLDACAKDLDLDQTVVSTCMTSYPDAFDPEMDVATAADWLLGAGYRHLPVVDGDVVIGMLSIKDILWALTAPSEI
jgi:CBS domain-containing protein